MHRQPGGPCSALMSVRHRNQRGQYSPHALHEVAAHLAAVIVSNEAQQAPMPDAPNNHPTLSYAINVRPSVQPRPAMWKKRSEADREYPRGQARRSLTDPAVQLRAGSSRAKARDLSSCGRAKLARERPNKVRPGRLARGRPFWRAAPAWMKSEMKRAGERERSPAPISLTVIAAPGCTVP
jgi:hypothetical protein